MWRSDSICRARRRDPPTPTTWILGAGTVIDVELGVVDLDGPRRSQVSTLAAACEDVGFFRIPSAAVPDQIADAAWEAARDFFALPEDEMCRIEFPEPDYPYGYSPFRYESLAHSVEGAASQPDLKESLSVGPDCGSQGPTAAAEGWIRSPSLWPERPSGLRSAWQPYYRALALVAEQLMSVMAVALELPEGYFGPLIDHPISAMRAIHYPPLDGSSDGALRAGAHTDYGTLTILRTDAVDGLEIQRRDGTWSAVEHRPDTLVVNLGDSIAQWTNGRWRSTVHRVSCTQAASRQSLAFFHMANWDAVIECLPTCRVDGEEPLYPPVQAGPWLMRKYRSTVT
jgi:isopenicillin N synthase-like dioxygenase